MESVAGHCSDAEHKSLHQSFLPVRCDSLPSTEPGLAAWNHRSPHRALHRVGSTRNIWLCCLQDQAVRLRRWSCVYGVLSATTDLGIVRICCYGRESQKALALFAACPHSLLTACFNDLPRDCGMQRRLCLRYYVVLFHLISRPGT